MECFENRLQVRELLRGAPDGDDVDEALACVLRAPEQFEHAGELSEQLTSLRSAPTEARLLRCRGLLPPVSRAERAAVERRRSASCVEGTWGLGGE